MLRWFIGKRLNVAEGKLGASLDYLRHILRVSLRAFFKFAKIMPLAEHRRVLPPDAYYVGRIVATRHEDCGPCVQIEVNLAKKDGVSKDILRSVLDEKPDDLPAPLPTVYRFAEAVVTKSGDEEQLRPTLLEQYTEEGVVELALAIAVCRIFPTTKRGLGYAKSCSLVQVDVD